jgi:hypothetical protein
MEAPAAIAAPAPEQMAERVRKLFLAYFSLGVVQLLPAALFSISALSGYTTFSTSLMSRAEWYYMHHLDPGPIEMRLGWPRVYLGMAGLFLTPVLLLDIIAICSTLAGREGMRGNQVDVELQVRALRGTPFKLFKSSSNSNSNSNSNSSSNSVVLNCSLYGFEH